MEQGPTRYLSVAQVAEHLGMSPQTVVLWIKQRKLEAIQPGGPKGQYRIPASELARIAGRAA